MILLSSHNTQHELIAVNGQTTTCAFHKAVQQQYLCQVGKTSHLCYVSS